MSIATLYNTTATTQRLGTPTTDAYGAPKATYSTNLAAFPCRIEGIGGGAGAELIEAIKITDATHYLFTASRDITEKDRVVSGGVTYEVKFVNRRPGGTTHHMEVLLNEVRA